jgi:Flp pilus assembly protein TadB
LAIKEIPAIKESLGMSKERARRRAEREAAAEAERQRRARAVQRRAGRRRLVAPLARILERWGRRLRRFGGADSVLTRRRRTQDAALLAVLIVANAVLWYVEPRWSLRWTAIAVCVLAWPLLTVMLFNRRPSR